MYLNSTSLGLDLPDAGSDDFQAFLCLSLLLLALLDVDDLDSRWDDESDEDESKRLASLYLPFVQDFFWCFL